MNIVYTSSDAYTKCMAVSLFSLLRNNKEIEKLDIYVLSTDMSEKNKKKIETMCNGFGRSICFIDAGLMLQKAQKELGISEYRGGLNTYARALANQLLPAHLEEVLFIDSDTLVCGSLSGIKEFIDNDAVLCGVEEIMLCISGLCRENEDLYNECNHYLNCGILYINLKKWRAIDGDALIAECIKEHPEGFMVAEQSIINYSFRDYIGVIPPKYNYYTVLHGIDYKTILRRYKKRKLFSKRQIQDASNNPVIIHFVGDYWIRPWYRDNDCYYRSLYYKYYKSSPWGSEPLDKAPQYSLLFKIYYSFLRAIKRIGKGGLYFGFRYVFMEWIHERIPQIERLRSIDKRK